MRRVLLVEDDVLTADFAIETLRRSRPNWTVLHVTSLAGARTVVSEEAVCAVLLDLELPDADGVDSVVSLRSLTSAPVVVISGRTHLFEDVIRCGANATFGKLELDLEPALAFLETMLPAPLTSC